MGEKNEPTKDSDALDEQARAHAGDTKGAPASGYMDEYIEEFNEVYADDKAKEALEALLDSLKSVEKQHLYKQEIAEKCENVSLSDLTARSILRRFQGLGLMILITKVSGVKNGEEYVIPISTTLKPILAADGWGLRKEDLDGFPRAQELIQQFAERIGEYNEGLPIESEEAGTPYEAVLKHRLAAKSTGEALDNFDEISVDVDIRADSTEVNSNTTKYSFRIVGRAEGIATPRIDEIKAFLKQEMTKLTKAATQDVEPRCICGTIEEHLQRIEESGEGCTIAGDTHVAEFPEEGTVRFETALQNLEVKTSG